jgi:hypothetical protein
MAQRIPGWALVAIVIASLVVYVVVFATTADVPFY